MDSLYNFGFPAYLHRAQYGKTLAFLESLAMASRKLSIELDPPFRYGCIPCYQVARSALQYSPVKAYRDAANAGASSEGHPAHTCASANSSEKAACQGTEKNIFNPLTSRLSSGSDRKRMTERNSALSYAKQSGPKYTPRPSLSMRIYSDLQSYLPSTVRSTRSRKMQRKSVTGSTCFGRRVYSVVHVYDMYYSTAYLNALHNACIEIECMKTNQRQFDNAQNADRLIADERIRQDPAKSKMGQGWPHTYPLLSHSLFQ